MIEIRRTFNRDRGFKLVEPLNGYTFTPETNAHTFFIECVDKVNGLETVVPFDAGSTVSARFLKTDHVTELVEGSLNTDGAAVVTLPSECYSVPGRFLLTILVTTGSTTICVYAATGTVIAADSSTVNVSENASREIDEKIAELNAAAAQVSSAISAGSAKITEINQAAAAARASIPQDYTALSDSVGDLKGAINYCSDNAVVEIEKNVVWQNGYVDTEGTVINSNRSGYTLVPLLKGERVVVGTNNKNITIVGSTTAESISVGDSVHVIQITGIEDEFETHEYIAPNDMTVVICVLLSDYSLAFYRDSAVYTDISERIKKIDNRNIIGLDPNRYYPVNIPVGTILTMSTADGTALGQNGLNLDGYDADKNKIDTWNFNPTFSMRTITWANSDAYYLKWSTAPVKNVQVELGSKATDYQKYRVDTSNEFVIDELLGDDNSATTDLVVQNTFVSDYTEHDYMSAVSRYNALVLESSGDNEQFLFFTDPHLAVQSGGGEGMIDITYDFINHLNAVYNASPVSFFVDGGDWLGNSDTPEVAANKLTFIDGFMRKKIKDYYPLNGNHDTNYQGKATPESALYTGKISNAILIKLRNMFRCANRMYYHFSGPTSSWYCFDTGTENEQIGSYQTEQLTWFAESLLSDTSAHIVIAGHILYPGAAGSTVQPLTDKILEIAETYNARGTIAVDGKTYDFSTKSGVVAFCITGHMHADWTGTVHNIPCIITTNAGSGGVLTFDLCLADWTNKKLYLQRVGNGEDREVNIL